MRRSAMKSDTTSRNASVNRRNFLVYAGSGAGMLAAGMVLSAATPAKASAGMQDDRTQPRKSQPGESPSAGAFGPDGIRLVISISMQFEAGGEPPRGTDNTFPTSHLPPSVPYPPSPNPWFGYGSLVG